MVLMTSFALGAVLEGSSVVLTVQPPAASVQTSSERSECDVLLLVAQPRRGAGYQQPCSLLFSTRNRHHATQTFRTTSYSHMMATWAASQQL